MFYKDDNLAVFIDGANLYAASRALGFEIDFKLMRNEFSRRGRLQRISYYTALLETEEFNPVKPLIDWLSYNGYSVVTKSAREFFDPLGRRKIKGSIDLELAIDALDIAPKLNHLVLFSGDGDFKPLVMALQRHGVRVSVVSTIRTNPVLISDDLRRIADNFIELEDLREVIAKPERVRESRDAAESALEAETEGSKA